MAARIIAIHDECEFLAETINALGHAGYDAVGFTDPAAALDTLIVAPNADLLITRVRFGPGKPQGVALAKMARANRPNLKVIFTARREFNEQIRDLGTLIRSPVLISVLMKEVGRLLTPPDRSESASGPAW
jgi:hypothetical protein